MLKSDAISVCVDVSDVLSTVEAMMVIARRTPSIFQHSRRQSVSSTRWRGTNGSHPLRWLRWIVCGSGGGSFSVLPDSFQRFLSEMLVVSRRATPWLPRGRHECHLPRVGTSSTQDTQAQSVTTLSSSPKVRPSSSTLLNLEISHLQMIHATPSLLCPARHMEFSVFN